MLQALTGYTISSRPLMTMSIAKSYHPIAAETVTDNDKTRNNGVNCEKDFS
jgi:hypothetical protein